MIENVTFTVVLKKKNVIEIKSNENSLRPIWKNNNLKAHSKNKK